MIVEKRQKSLLLILGAVILLIGGGAVAYWLLVQKRAAPGNIPVGANVVPQDALMAVSISTNPGQWQSLRSFGTPQTQAALDQNLAQLRDRLLSANGYNYQKDIQPWVGKEITVAFVAPQASPPSPSPAPSPNLPAPTSPRNQALMLVLPIDNQGRARQVLENPKPPESGKWIDRTYKGFQLKETQGSSTQNYSATVLDGRYLVVTTDPKATERAIDTYKGQASLATTPGYNQAAGEIGLPSPFAKLYINVPAAAGVASANSNRPLPPTNLAQLQQNQGVAATLALAPEGVQIKGISWLKPDSQKKLKVQNNARNMPERIPADTLVMVSGGNLKQLWQDYVQGAESNPAAQDRLEGLRSGVKSNSGLDLDQDLIAWMGGEFSLSVVPAAQTAPSNFPVGLVLMAQASDRRAAEKSLKQFDTVMGSKYKFAVEAAKVGNQPVVNLTQPLVGLTVTHGWLDNNVAFLTLGAPLASGIVPKPATPLAENQLYKATVPTELNPNNGHFFIDVDRAINGNQFSGQFLPPEYRLWVGGIQALGVTAAINNERSTRYDMFVTLHKAGQPGPLPSPAAGDRGSASPQTSPVLPSP